VKVGTFAAKSRLPSDGAAHWILSTNSMDDGPTRRLMETNPSAARQSAGTYHTSGWAATVGSATPINRIGPFLPLKQSLS
jgi:hypothetical protein